MKVFLIGFMGCGKSRRGKELAAQLGWSFVDLDAEIEKVADISITQYFAQYGEPAFRKLESEILRAYNFANNSVIAVGGGLPCFYSNIEWMNAQGITIYLKMRPEALISRLGNRDKRPLIKGMDDKTLLHFIREKLQERSPFYEKAAITVEGLNLTTADLIRKLHE